MGEASSGGGIGFQFEDLSTMQPGKKSLLTAGGLYVMSGINLSLDALMVDGVCTVLKGQHCLKGKGHAGEEGLCCLHGITLSLSPQFMSVYCDGSGSRSLHFSYLPNSIMPDS